MKTPQSLTLGALVVFVLSHLLPAYENASGFSCFRFCGEVLLRREETQLGAWFYYSGFAIANLLFIGLVATQFFTKQGRNLRSVVSVICFLHVLSWLVLHIIPDPSQLAELKIGYYVWLIAYGLLVTAHLWKAPAAAPGSIPLASSAV
jgi:hypothetical protein